MTLDQLCTVEYRVSAHHLKLFLLLLTGEWVLCKAILHLDRHDAIIAIRRRALADDAQPHVERVIISHKAHYATEWLRAAITPLSAALLESIRDRMNGTDQRIEI